MQKHDEQYNKVKYKEKLILIMCQLEEVCLKTRQHFARFFLVKPAQNLFFLPYKQRILSAQIADRRFIFVKLKNNKNNKLFLKFHDHYPYLKSA